MNRFEQVQLWQNTLAKQLDPDPHEKQRETLRVGFEQFRERAKILAAEISRYLPEFTVHDITHIDALWETANILIDDQVINPAEAFVLGGAFLVHDLGMGLAAYPKGIDELKKESIWRDTVAASFRKKHGRPIKEKDFENLDPNLEKAALANVLRLLHAKQAENLGFTKWKNQNDDDQFLIEKTDLRESYGNVIGLIAHSHWWSVDELVKGLPPVLGSPGMFPSEWTVDAVKLACILRVADAMQIDDRRAPSFLRTIRKPSSYSDQHWNFQLKLYQPRIEGDRVIFSSKSPFKIDEVDSWWICYDTLKMIDRELKGVDSLLADTNRKRLNAIGVASIEDPARLSKLITVENWQPVDTKIKVSNVAKLVGNLGGKALYGDNAIVPIRELIQNSSDAIRARRLLENEGDEFGTIHIELGRDDEGDFIVVSDNGIGMSPKVLTGPFLDFGESFWGTSFMHEELPGLESKGFASTGRYGIGFFSVFMIGDKVNVTSKRFEDARGNSLTLEFNNGVNSRPILRPASKDEIIKDGGTKVKIWVKPQTIDNLLEQWDRKYKKITLGELVETLCPSIDCNIDITEKEKTKRIINANDWISIPPVDLIKRIIGRSSYNGLPKKEKDLIKRLSVNMETIQDGENGIVARGFIFFAEKIQFEQEVFSYSGIVTLGGLRSCKLNGLIGIFKGNPVRASRDVGIPIISNERLGKWATSQAKCLQSLELDFETQLECASMIRGCGGSTEELKVAYHKTGCLNFQELKDVISKSNSGQHMIVQHAAISNYERNNNCKIEFNSNVIWVTMSIPFILDTSNTSYHIWWPKPEVFGNDNKIILGSLKGLIIMIICEHWNCSIPEIVSSSKISSDEKLIGGVIGKSKNQEVIIDHLDIMIKPK